MQSNGLDKSKTIVATILFWSSCSLYSASNLISICCELHIFQYADAEIDKKWFACFVTWSKLDNTVTFEKTFNTLTDSPLVCTRLSLMPLSTGSTKARFALSGKVFADIEVFLSSANGLDKTLTAIFTSREDILSSLAALLNLIFLISFSTSSTLTLQRVREFEFSKLIFGYDTMILGCDSYLLIILVIVGLLLMKNQYLNNLEH